MSDSRERFEARCRQLGRTFEWHPLLKFYSPSAIDELWEEWQAAERDALERAAKVCEALADRTPLIGERSGALKCATSIRALAGKE